MITAEQFTSYCEEMGLDIGNDVAIDIALQRAKQYINTKYDFKGVALGDDAFPRDLWPTVPSPVVCALSELALKVTTGVELWRDVDTSSGAVVSETIGPISVRYDGAQPYGQMRFPMVDALLKPYVKGEFGSVRAYRG